MKLREEQWLEEQLELWTREALITSEQRAAIQAYRQRTQRSLSGLLILAALGGLLVAFGVILVIAHNWEEIPYPLRLVGFGVVLAVAGLTAERVQARWLRAAAEAVWLMLPLAGIGLWGQVYQLSGDPLRPLLVWLALGAPLALLRPGLPAVVHTAGAVITAYVGAFSADTWLSLGHSNARSFAQLAVEHGLALAGLGLLWALILWRARSLDERVRLLIVLAGCGFLFGLGAEGPLELDAAPGMFLLAGAIVLLFWGARPWLELTLAKFEHVGVGAAAVLGYVLTFLWDEEVRHASLDAPAQLYLGLVVAAGLGAWGRAVWLERTSRSPAYLALVGACAAPFVLGGALFFGAAESWVALLANLAVLGLGIALLHAAVSEGRRDFVNLGVLFVAGLVTTRFFDLFGTMLESGLGFIVTGLALIGIAYASMRGRQRLLAATQKEPT